MHGNYKKERNSKLYKMREDGFTLRVIGETFGITYARVQQILHSEFKRKTLEDIKNKRKITEL